MPIHDQGGNDSSIRIRCGRRRPRAVNRVFWLILLPPIVAPVAHAFSTSNVQRLAPLSPWTGRTTTKRQLPRLFVLTTPEAIIEQASTTSLLDDLIDESIRTSARRPLIMQFDPSSGWIWKRWKVRRLRTVSVRGDGGRSSSHAFLLRSLFAKRGPCSPKRGSPACQR
jgi:hypothetical protein